MGICSICFSRLMVIVEKHKEIRKEPDMVDDYKKTLCSRHTKVALPMNSQWLRRYVKSACKLTQNGGVWAHNPNCSHWELGNCLLLEEGYTIVSESIFSKSMML